MDISYQQDARMRLAYGRAARGIADRLAAAEWEDEVTAEAMCCMIFDYVEASVELQAISREVRLAFENSPVAAGFLSKEQRDNAIRGYLRLEHWCERLSEQTAVHIEAYFYEQHCCIDEDWFFTEFYEARARGLRRSGLVAAFDCDDFTLTSELGQ